jgi:hypothetical protein
MRETEERHGMGLFDFLGGRERNADRGSSSNDRPSSIEINGRTVTDPAQIDRIERNREASARNAVDSYQREGTPIPAHLRDTVDRQIARGDYGSTGGGPQRGNLLDLFLGPPPGSTASILGTPRPGPTPGPGYYAGLGTPGVARDDFVPVVLPGAATAAPVATDTVAADPAAADPAPAPVVAPAVPIADTVFVNASPQFTFDQYLQMANAQQAAPPFQFPFIQPTGSSGAFQPAPVRMSRGGDVNKFASGSRPNMKEFMDATGADAATASQLLYGAVGSNVDVRDWSKIMSSSNPVQAAQTATAQMYSLPEDVPIATDERFYDRETGSYNPRAVAIEGAQPVAGSSRLQVLPNGEIYILSQSGLPLTGLSPSNAASFGITQAEIDAAIAAGGSNQENRLSGVGYQPYEGGNLLVDYSSLTAPRFSTPPPATGAGVGASPVAGAGASSAALPSFISPGGAGGTPAATGPVFPGLSIPSFITPVGGGAAYQPADLPGYNPAITGMRPAPNVGVTPSGATAYSPYGAIAPYQFPELAPNFFGINSPAYLEFLTNGTQPQPQMQMAVSPMQQGIMSLPPTGLMG